MKLKVSDAENVEVSICPHELFFLCKMQINTNYFSIVTSK